MKEDDKDPEKMLAFRIRAAEKAEDRERLAEERKEDDTEEKRMARRLEVSPFANFEIRVNWAEYLKRRFPKTFGDK